jgi:Zn-dependent protease
VIFGGGSIEQILAIAVALVVGITFHEFSHAFVADSLGDHRPRALGRVSLNPLRHLDPLGAIFLLLVGFGWGKPVPVNPASLRPGRVGLAYVSAAGPIANVAVAVVFAVVLRVLEILGVDSSLLLGVLAYIVLLNLALAIFNLLPIAPLDGWNFVMGVAPLRTVFTLQRYQQYGLLLLLLLVVLSYSGAGPINWIFDLATALARLLIG